MENDSKLKVIFKYFNLQYYKTNLSFCIFLFIYSLIQVFLVILQIFAYISETVAVIVARSAGILLDFNMSFIILLVLNRCITWIGNIKILRICLPINDFPKIHRLIGIYILLLSIIHTVSHCINTCKYFVCYYILNNSCFNKDLTCNEKTVKEYFEALFNRRKNIDWFYGLAFPMGWAILILMILIDIFTIPVIRQKRYFEARNFY
jgi:NADPH oxidase 5